MITLYGEGRGFRVAWLLEEMGLPYRLRQVDLLGGVENDTQFLAINPAGFIPAIVDGDTVMVESIAIMEYLLARHGPSPLVPTVDDPAFGPYQQFLHMGEAGLAGPVNAIVATRVLAPEAEQDNWTTRAGRSRYSKAALASSSGNWREHRTWLVTASPPPTFPSPMHWNSRSARLGTNSPPSKRLILLARKGAAPIPGR